MEINRNFYIKIDEDGNQIPMMEFFPPKYSMLSHLGFGDFSKSNKIEGIIREISDSVKKSVEYSFASDDWCIVKIIKDKSIISNGFEEFEEFEIDTSFVIKLLSDWAEFLKKYETKKIPGIYLKQDYNNNQNINYQGSIKNSEDNSNQVLSTYLYKKEKIELVYTGYELGYRDSIVEKFKVISNLKKTIVSEFNSSIKHRLNSFSFAYKNWIFIPEVFHYYLYDLENEEIFNQTVWFRENKHNYQDSNIGNYFAGNNHFSINRKSFVVFDLIKEEKQVIKPKDLLGEISWAYMLNSMTIRFFFNSENRTALFNITDGRFYSIKPIVVNKKTIKLIHTKKYAENEGNHITNFKVVIDDMANEYFQFTEKIKQSS